MKKLIYIGNNLEAKNPTTIALLSALFVELGFKVTIYSSKEHKVLRLIDMCFGVLKHKNVDYLLIDTYSASNFYYAVITSQLARFFNLKYIPILHGGNLPKRLKNSPFLSNLLFKHSKVNIAPSNYLLEKFQQKGFHTQFIPNAIVLENYPFKLRSNVVPKILWVRAFDTMYNPEMALKVLVALKKTHPNASLCMVGPDKDGSLELTKRAAKKYGIQDAVEFTGLLDKKTWIERSKEFSIFINTTTVDNTPVTVIEAMALGLPVVSTNVGGISYLIEDSVNGILVENNNALEMTEKILELLKNAKKVKEITINARNMVCKFKTDFVRLQWKEILN